VVAKRAELAEDDFWLHKFRATFATRALRSGVDLRTVQMWMGHTDLESTMRYLKPNRGKAVREKVNAMFAWNYVSDHGRHHVRSLRILNKYPMPH
jgi:integrase